EPRAGGDSRSDAGGHEREENALRSSHRNPPSGVGAWWTAFTLRGRNLDMGSGLVQIRWPPGERPAKPPAENPPIPRQRFRKPMRSYIAASVGALASAAFPAPMPSSRSSSP